MSRMRKLFKKPNLSKALYDFYFEAGLRGFGSNLEEVSSRIVEQHLKDDYVVLDVGCGKGFYVNLASKHIKHCVGTDISFPLLKDAQSNFRASNVDFVQASWDALPFREKIFDMVMWFDGPEHAINPKFTLFNIRGVMKKFLLVSAPVSTPILIIPEFLETKLNKIFAVLFGKPFRSHINAYMPRTLIKLLTSSGLVVLDYKTSMPHMSIFKQFSFLLRGFFWNKKMFGSIVLCSSIYNLEGEKRECLKCDVQPKNFR